MTEALEVLLDIFFVVLLIIPVALIIWGMISSIRADKKRVRKHGYRNSDNLTFAWAILGWIVLLLFFWIPAGAFLHVTERLRQR